jgi:hypothetical protein
MNVARKAVKDILSNDPILQAMLGRDNRNQPKVYESVGKKGVDAPYIVFTMMQSEGPEGLYHDLRSLETVRFQVTGWGLTRDQAWELFEAAQTALEIGEWSVYLTPYSFMSIVRTGDQFQLEDVDSGWYQVPATYRLKVSR